MASLQDKIELLDKFKSAAILKFFTLGQFCLYRNEKKIGNKEWGRDKTLQLIQYLISNRQRHALHKEKIMDDLWEDWNDRDFKVAMHGVNKVMEPDRASRTEPNFIIRQGVSYCLDLEKVWIDVEILEQYIIIGNEALNSNVSVAKKAFKEAIAIYQGVYLPNRIYEDWTSEEREKIQMLILGAYINLAELTLEDNPLESVRLSQHALAIDPTWEDAYRIQMEAYTKKGNRPQALKAYKKCELILEKEYGIQPLPETKKLIQRIKEIG